MFIVRDDSALSVTGLFETATGALLNQGAILDLKSSTNGQTYWFQISYHGDTASGLFDAPNGNDIALRMVAVPEPISGVSIVIAFAVTACSRRRNKCLVRP
jgi:hypothetical protein